MKRYEHNVMDIRFRRNTQSIPTFLVLIIVNIVVTWMFVGIIFNMSLFAAVSFKLALFDSPSFQPVLSNICLSLMFRFNGRHGIFNYVQG